MLFLSISGILTFARKKHGGNSGILHVKSTANMIPTLFQLRICSSVQFGACLLHCSSHQHYFSGFHQHIRNELYEFSLFKENEWPKKGSKRGSSYVYTHVGCVTYLFMINPHFQFRFACRWPLRITCFMFNLPCTDIFLEN